jgi:hypothetical protein
MERQKDSELNGSKHSHNNSGLSNIKSISNGCYVRSDNIMSPNVILRG